MGIFDDLIPQEPQKEAAPKLATGGIFDDLVPQTPQTQTAPKTSSGGLFDDLIPDSLPSAVRYPIEATKGFAEGAKANVSQAAIGYSAAGRGFDKRQLEFMDAVDQGWVPPPAKNMDQNRIVLDPYGYLDMTGAQREEFRRQNQATMEMPTEQRPLYRAGKTLEGIGSSITEPAPGFEKSWTRDIGSGFGSVGGNIATAMIPYAGPAVAPAMYIGAGAGQQYEDAKRKGATEDQALRAASLGTIAGATDLMDAALPALGSPGKVVGLIKRVGWGAIKDAFAEGGQEGLQQFIQNVIAKNIYNPNQDLSEDVAYNAAIGMIVGGGVGAYTGARHDTQGPAPTAANVAAANAPLTPQIPNAGAPTGPLGPAPPPAMPPTSTPMPPPVSQVPRSGMFVDPNEDIFQPQNPTHDTSILASGETGVPAAPPTLAELQASGDVIPADVVARVQEMARSYNRMPVETMTRQQVSGVPSAAREQIEATPGMNIRQVSNVLSSSLYGDPTIATPITVKEMVQNAFDGIKTSLEKQGLENGHVNILMNPSNREVTITDNGSGMLPSTLAGPFLTVGGTLKENSRPSGGLGIAKMMIIFMNKKIRVTTMRDGKVAELNSTGPELQAALEGDKSKKIQVSVRSPTSADVKLFPDGHGTQVQVQIPQTFHDPSSGEVKEIPFYSGQSVHPVLQNSPLFAPIDVTMNGQTLPIGNSFPAAEYQRFRNVGFGWGTARIYVSTSPSETRDAYAPNVHVLSNGLWQFDGEIKKDPSRSWGPNIPVNIYIDLDSKVAAGQPGYPFAPNRQDFSPAVKSDFQKLFTYLSLVYQQADLENLADNFGEMQFLSSDGKSLTTTVAKKIQPSKATKGGQSGILDPTRIENASWAFKDGNLIVDGKQTPDLSPSELEKFKLDTTNLRIPQSEVDPHAVMIHNNIDVVIDPLTGPQSIVDYGRKKFGERFDEYLFFVGSAFRELRDQVVRIMPKSVPQNNPTMWDQVLETVGLPKSTTPVNGYEGLKEWGVGVSFDTQYRGVSVTLPFNAMFINPILPRHLDPIKGGYYTVMTMIHEIAHYKVRSHEDSAGFPQEFQELTTQLATSPDYNHAALVQKVVDVFARYNDILAHMNGVVTSGNFDVQPRGQRFKGGTLEASDASQPGQSTGLSQGTGGTSGLRAWLEAGAESSAGESRRGDYAFETANAGVGNGPSVATNRRAIDAEAPGAGAGATEQQPETQFLRSLSAAANLGVTPPGIASGAAHADKMNRWYKWMAGLDQLVQRNPRFIPLLRYYERVIGMHNEEANIQDAAVRVMKDWRRLGRGRSEKLVALIDDVSNMRYRTPQEVRQGIRRQPTNQELQTLISKHQVDQRTLAVYTKVRAMFDGFLGTVQRNAFLAAQRSISDPVLLAQKVDEIRAQIDELRKTPYFPFMNFGRHFVTATNAKGETLHFETFERRGLKSAERLQMAKAAELRVQPGVTNVRWGLLPEATTPFIGMPATLLSDIKADPGVALTQQQKDALDLLIYNRTAQSGFASRFKQKQYIPGYSFDFQRAFAKYFFHGARYAARQQYLGELRDQIAAARAVNGNRPNMIADYMDDHLANTVLDSRGDYGMLKGAITLWALGYVPATAFQNLTQTPLLTFPFLSAKFGEHRAIPTMLKAMGQISTYYKRGRYDNATEFENRALGYGIRTGRVSETQAPELAGYAQGMNMLLGYGGNQAQRGWSAFMEKSMWTFEMMEQINRRVAYRATLNLAMQNPNAKFVQESVHLHNDEYQRLIAGTPLGTFTPQQAAAIVTAANATDQTQFVYARYARPRLFRGRKGILLVFKKYMQSTLMMLGNNKSDVLPRYILIAAALGGLGGLPFYDDLKAILQALGEHFFKKDFNLDHEVKKYTNQFSNGTIDPDLVLHGLARKGYGVPMVLDLFGKNKGRGLVAPAGPGQNVPFPMFDRSKSISMGNAIPGVGLLKPTNDVKDQIADEAQNASGAAFSVAFNFYKALQDQKNDWGDFKRWERTMPHALSNLSKTWRAFSEGRDRGPGGVNSAATTIPYDVRDTEQMMEAMGLALGYTPLRLQMKWDSNMAKAEVEKFFDLQQQGLKDQFFEATFSQNPKEVESVKDSIRAFNSSLPDWARGRSITADMLEKSLQAKAMDKVKREAGVPRSATNAGIEQRMNELYPQFGGPGMIDVRRVK